MQLVLASWLAAVAGKPEASCLPDQVAHTVCVRVAHSGEPPPPETRIWLESGELQATRLLDDRGCVSLCLDPARAWSGELSRRCGGALTPARDVSWILAERRCFSPINVETTETWTGRVLRAQ